MSRSSKKGGAPEDARARPLPAETLRREFRDPSSEYGPIDCWWWEAGRLSQERMRMQLEDMKEKGIAGTWYYPRFSKGEPLQSDPPYWTDGWWDFTRFSMEEHKRLGLAAWFSDWTGLGLFQDKVREEGREHPELVGRRLAIHERETTGPGPVRIEIPAEEEILHAAAYRKTDSGLDCASEEVLTHAVVNNRLTWAASGEGWTVTVITARPRDLDYLNGAVVNRWLELMLGMYEAQLPEHVGGTMQAFGPDEMLVLEGNILYSPGLVERFKTEKGYDPLPHLAAIFHDIGERTDKVRCDYYDVMISLLDENLYKPIADWLHERGMLYTTIATWGRRSPVDQTYHYGDFFRMMRHFDVTGNEDPRPSDVGGRAFKDAKFSSSIAHLYGGACAGGKRVAVCGYWGSGWGVTQEQNLSWTCENYAYGINFYNRHGVLYSTLGGWYEWVPPAVHFRQPYWQYWRRFTDLVRRLSYIMSQGEHVSDVAILYPLTTIHAGWATGENFSNAAREASARTVELAEVVYRSGLDFDFIDYPSLCRSEITGGRLNVSGLAFPVVLLPALTTIRTDTLEKLREFHASGGTVVAFGRLPDASPECGQGDRNVRRMVKEIFGVDPSDKPSSVAALSNARGGKAFFVPADASQVPSIISGAITRDVVVSEGDIFHTHQKAADADIYLFFNVRPEPRPISVTLRDCGEPEIWDPSTGRTRPVHRFDLEAGGTKVHLDMEPYQGLVLVVAPPEGRPRAVADNLKMITALEPSDGGISVEGFCESGGHKRVNLVHAGAEYRAEADVDGPPEAFRLDGNWSIRLEPTMDNRCGDFRYPPSNELIGAEARRFRYVREGSRPGTSLRWHERDFDDSDWPSVTYTHGPYWWALGPFGEDHEPRHILDKAIAGEFDAEGAFESAGRPFRWEQYGFSMKYGNEEPAASEWMGMEGVPDDFLVFQAVSGGKNVVRYLFAHVRAPEAGQWMLDFGGQAKLARGAWVNGKEVLSTSGEQPETQARVSLNEGWNSVILRIVQPEGKAVRTYAALFDPASPPAPDPYVPLLRWFREPQALLFDVTPNEEGPVGWYRVTAPPGLKSMRLKLRARSVQAWVDGALITEETIICPEVSRDGSEVILRLTSPLRNSSQVALRIEQRAGCYAGAAFAEPVAFECGEGEIPLGDWCGYGLDMYSGAAVYSRTVNLEKTHLEGRAYLDIGQAMTVAEIFVNGKTAGVRLGRPFRFDVTDFLREGKNRVQVKVANTLANHMSSYPTQYIHAGQTAAGLLGPVRLQFLRGVTMAALPSCGEP